MVGPDTVPMLLYGPPVVVERNTSYPVAQADGVATQVSRIDAEASTVHGPLDELSPDGALSVPAV